MYQTREPHAKGPKTKIIRREKTKITRRKREPADYRYNDIIVIYQKTILFLEFSTEKIKRLFRIIHVDYNIGINLYNTDKYYQKTR